MQSKRDQLLAHNFVAGRMRSALLQGDADAVEPPTRRFTVAALAGILVAGLLVAAAGVYGFLVPGGNTRWRDAGKIIVEKETGTRYLYRDGLLRPVLNFASARLLAGASAEVLTVSRKSLAGTGHGLPLGIPGAPDSLPPRGSLLTTAWQACTPTTGTTATAPAVARVGGGVTGTALDDEAGVRVDGLDGTAYLLWHGRRIRLADAATRTAVHLDQTRPVPVSVYWLAALPAGPDMSAPRIEKRGDRGPRVGSRPTRVGQVLRLDTATDDYRLVLPDGLAPVSPLLASVVLADPAVRGAYPGGSPEAITVSPADVAAAAVSSRAFTVAEHPGTAPRWLDPDTVAGQDVCAVLDSGAGRAAFTRTAPVRAGETGVLVPGGQGALVCEAGPACGVLYLVTDMGLRFPVPTSKAAEQLGYQGVAPVGVPGVLLGLVPAGPALDPEAASRPVLPGRPGQGPPPGPSPSAGAASPRPGGSGGSPAGPGA